MSDLFCDICGNVKLPGFAHKCPPIWLCSDLSPEELEELGASQTSVRASDAAEAAELYAELGDRGEDVSGEQTVWVQGVDGKTEKFIVRGAMEPHYHAESEGA